MNDEKVCYKCKDPNKRVCEYLTPLGKKRSQGFCHKCGLEEIKRKKEMTEEE